jgi:GntR family transcriptional regulator
MPDDTQHTPYYVQIKTYLKKLAAEKAPHESMPSETQLATMFQVSRGTVKQAVMDLVYEGVLYRKQGKGTFVAPQRFTRSFQRLPSFTDDIRRTGCNVGVRVLSLKRLAPTPYLQALFGLPQDAGVLKVKRLVSMDNSPIVIVTSYLNPDIYPTLQADELGDSLYEALRKKYGVVPVKAQDTYSIVEISPHTAELLDCEKNASVCFSRRVAFLSSGKPVEYVESFIRSDRFQLEVCIGMDSPEPSAKLLCNDSAAGSTYHDVGFRNVIL